jgi:hypothetical protein
MRHCATRLDQQAGSRHPGVLLIGTSSDCGLTTSLGNFPSPDLTERQLRSPFSRARLDELAEVVASGGKPGL